jgi:hypothetical protein
MLAGALPVHGQTHELPRSLVAAALSELKPSAFAPLDLAVEDYAVARLDASPDASLDSTGAARVGLVAGSLQWVRVADVVLVPRAVLRVSAPGISAGQVRYGTFVHPFVIDDRGGRVDVPVALLTASQHVVIETLRAGVARIERFGLRFTPRPERRGRVVFDSSCSPSGLRPLHGAIPPNSLLYVGCRQVRTQYGDRGSASLELYAVWTGVEDVHVEGVATEPLADALYAVRVAPKPGFVRLGSGAHTLVLGYTAAEHMPAAFLGAGLGPYAFHYEDAGVTGDAWLPVLTLYAGYAFAPDTRIVYFNAITPDVRGSIDQGLYLWLEQARFLDERMSFNLLLGGNVLVYRHAGKTRGRLSAPQGFELVARDVLTRNVNLIAGAFLYPELEGRSYYNLWLRLGTRQFFGEINYIEWQEPHDDSITRSRVIGVSFGTPVLRFL